MPTIRRVDPDSAVQNEIDQFREWCKSVLSVAALALYVAVVFWPVMLAK